jgi:hypothetical protein
MTGASARPLAVVKVQRFGERHESDAEFIGFLQRADEVEQ